MRKLLTSVQNFGRSEEGPTAVEYAVMLALILLVCLASIQTFGSATKQSFTNTAQSIAS